MKPHILILAAGKGTRMVSDLPKVLHPLLFHPILHHVLDVALSLHSQSISVVVGHGEAQVRAECASYPGLNFVSQKEQKGTGHAVQMAEPLLSGKTGKLLVLSGDVALLRKETLEALMARQVSNQAAAAILTARLSQPKGYGRILREGELVQGIREEKDCSEEERKITEVNSGIYCFELAGFFEALAQLQDRNAQKEFYLTDVIGILRAEGKRVTAEVLDDAEEMMGINDRRELALVESKLQTRTNDRFMREGVSLQRPESIFLDPRCRIAPDVRIETGCQILGSTLERGVVVESHSRIVNCTLKAKALIKQGSVLEKSMVGENCSVGPYAHLRSDSWLERGVKLGNFVETKKAHLKEGAKASHLSYIGDAEIGRDANLGCGFITCNYDGGPVKHRTIIEDGVFIGSDSQAVAPLRVGKDSYIASGTTLTEDVPENSLALSRGRQITKIGYANKYLNRRKKET